MEVTSVGFVLHKIGHPILSFPRTYLDFVLRSLVMIELDGCVLACHIMWHLQFYYCIFHESKDTKDVWHTVV